MPRYSIYLIIGGMCFVAGAAAILWVQPWTTAVPLEEYTDLPLESATGSLEENVLNIGTWENVTVLRVIDGDTVELVGGERMRLIGIDAPERGTCFADESANVLELFVSGKTLRLEPGVKEHDQYGRRLGYLHDEAILINEVLVSRGAAIAKAYPPDIVYAALFAQQEAQAKAAERGLWGLCGGLRDSEVIDSETIVQMPPSVECAIKGNVSSSGERIYHVLGCGSYEKTQIDVRADERWFCTEQEAKDAGWRKAQNCP